MNFPDAELIEQLARLERANDIPTAFQMLCARNLSPEDLGGVAISLFRHDLSALAFIIAEKLLESGYEHWTLRALSCHLGVRLAQPAAVAASMPRLSELLEHAAPAEQQAAQDLVDPFLPRDVVQALRTGNNALVRGYARLWAALDPRSRKRFAIPAPGRTPDVARFHRPAESTPLRPYDLPPAGVPHTTRSVVLAARRYWAPADPASREHDIPARIDAALASYGWKPLRCDLRSFDDPGIVAEDYRAIAAACRESRPDVLIVDEFQTACGDDSAAGEIIKELKRELPRLRIVGLYLDPWVPERWSNITASAASADAIWSPVITAVWQHPSFIEKTLFIPLPHGGTYSPRAQRRPGFGFHGGVQYSNWDRALWFSTLAELGLPLEGSISCHHREELAPLESYRLYMSQMSAHEGVLNFSRRSNGTHTLTARTFEVPAAGGLLVQERADDVDAFFVAGRHYLRFETLTDLVDIDHLIRTEPDFVESIRREGAAFFRERYADDRIIGYLDHFLFHRLAAQAA